MAKTPKPVGNKSTNRATPNTQVRPSPIVKPTALTEKSTNIAIVRNLSKPPAAEFQHPPIIQCSINRGWPQPNERGLPPPREFTLNRTDTYEDVVAKLDLLKAEMLPEGTWDPEDYVSGMLFNTTSARGKSWSSVHNFLDAADWKFALDELVKVTSQKVKLPKALVFMWCLRERDHIKPKARPPVQVSQPAFQSVTTERASERTAEWVTKTRERLQVVPENSSRRFNDDAVMRPDPAILRDLANRQYCKTCSPLLGTEFCFYNPVNDTHMRIEVRTQVQIDNAQARHWEERPRGIPTPRPEPCQQVRLTTPAPSRSSISEIELSQPPPSRSPTRSVTSSTSSESSDPVRAMVLQMLPLLLRCADKLRYRKSSRRPARALN